MDFDLTKLTTGHGSPEDRGGADFWYHRPRKPHWYPNGTYNEPEILEKDIKLLESKMKFIEYVIEEKINEILDKLSLIILELLIVSEVNELLS